MSDQSPPKSRSSFSNSLPNKASSLKLYNYQDNILAQYENPYLIKTLQIDKN